MGFKPVRLCVQVRVWVCYRERTLLTCRKVHQCPGGICTVLRFDSNFCVGLRRIWTSAGPEVPPDRLQTENMEAMDTIFICGGWHSFCNSFPQIFSPVSFSLHGDANLTEDTHCCWTMWSARSLMEAESLWSGGCQPAPPWSGAAQPVLRGLQHMEGERRKYEFRQISL